jgi:hypothetical protein
MVYAVDVNLLGENINTVKRKTQTLCLGTSKEVGPEL